MNFMNLSVDTEDFLIFLIFHQRLRYDNAAIFLALSGFSFAITGFLTARSIG